MDPCVRPMCALQATCTSGTGAHAHRRRQAWEAAAAGLLRRGSGMPALLATCSVFGRGTTETAKHASSIPEECSWRGRLRPRQWPGNVHRQFDMCWMKLPTEERSRGQRGYRLLRGDTRQRLGTRNLWQSRDEDAVPSLCPRDKQKPRRRRWRRPGVQRAGPVAGVTAARGSYRPGQAIHHSVLYSNCCA